MGIGDWGLGIGPNPQSPIPNPQSPIPNSKINSCYNELIKKINNYLLLIKFIKMNEKTSINIYSLIMMYNKFPSEYINEYKIYSGILYLFKFISVFLI